MFTATARMPPLTEVSSIYGIGMFIDGEVLVELEKPNDLARRIGAPAGLVAIWIVAFRKGADAQRWHSYDKASLTREALLQKVEAGLGRDADGESLKVNPEAKTISTAAGDLPISPIFDPAWMQARRKTAKAAPGPPLGRCPSSATSLPRYFLQDFELIKHPTSGTPWWAPGPLSFEHVQPMKRLDEAQANTIGNGHDGEAPAPEPMSAPVAGRKDNAIDSEKDVRRQRRAPITSYMLNRKLLVDMVGGPNKKYLAMLLAARSGMAIAPDSKTAVWREDMGDVLLQMMRQQATDALATRGNRLHEPKHKFIEPCANWKDVESVRLRGCVLWLPEKKKDAADQYATLDIEGAQYGKKMVRALRPGVAGPWGGLRKDGNFGFFALQNRKSLFHPSSRTALYGTTDKRLQCGTAQLGPGAAECAFGEPPPMYE
ncbi:hypothetical protein TrVFT333_011676 [Trichoderma virens FT-333]|nr:hypothetical protein TrVFT333_011676 [Trichoderma virens FT-333]